MSKNLLPFKYQSEKNTSGLTGLAGLPLYVELAVATGFTQSIEKVLKTRTQGWSDVEMVLSLILLNLAGGDCVSDINRLEQDGGLRTLLPKLGMDGLSRKEKDAYAQRWRKNKQQAFPSKAAIHRFLACFHAAAEENKRVEGKAFIPAISDQLQSLIDLNQHLINTCQQAHPYTEATLDQDATLVNTHKSTAYYGYKKSKAYQPVNTYWAEHGIIVHSEFRDGNVPAGYEQLRLLKTSLDLLPRQVTKAYLRSDSAGYQEELLKYCAEGENERFGVVEFAIAARVSASFKEAVRQVKDSDWHTVCRYEADGSKTETSQEWAEVCYVPNWVSVKNGSAEYRYLAIREKMERLPNKKGAKENELPFQTIETEQGNYKLFGLVTNRNIPGNDVIHWHRQRCGKSEQLHHIQKNELAGGQLPSCYFGSNAAWWQLMILAYNLSRLMQIVALPTKLKNRQMKALRFHLIQLPGWVIRHARQWWIQVEKSAMDLFNAVRKQIMHFAAVGPPNIVS